MAAPLNKFRNYGIEIAAWPTRNGGISFSIRKSYKDKTTGEYKETKTFFEKDLEVLAALLAEASQWATSQGSGAVEAHWEHLPSQPQPQPVAESAPDFNDEDLPF